MRRRLGEPVLSVAGRHYDWLDVVLWASGWGEWARFEADVRRGLACARRAEEDAAAGFDEGAVEDAATEFRYERGLLSAEEMDAWLAGAGLTAEDWMASVERAVLRRRWVDETEEILEAFPISDDDVAAALWCDGVCSGELIRFANELARRAAVHARLREEADGRDDVLGPESRDMRAVRLEGLDDTVALLGCAPSPDRLAHLACLEVALRRFSAAVLTPRAIRDQIGARYLEWIRLDCLVLSVPDEQVAREAVALVREESQSLPEVAELARATLEETRIYLDEVEPVLAEPLRGASKGDLVGPVAVDDQFWLVLVRDKVMPTEEDPAIRRRAEEGLLARLLARDVEARVRWHHPLAKGAP